MIPQITQIQLYDCHILDNINKRMQAYEESAELKRLVEIE